MSSLRILRQTVGRDDGRLAPIYASFCSPPQNEMSKSTGSNQRASDKTAHLKHLLFYVFLGRPKHVPVNRLPVLIDRRFAPAPGVVPKGGSFGDGGVETRDFETRV